MRSKYTVGNVAVILLATHLGGSYVLLVIHKVNDEDAVETRRML